MFRPWGLFDWAIALGGSRDWDFVGCLGPEERSITALLVSSAAVTLKKEVLCRIEELGSPHASIATKNLLLREEECKNAKLSPDIKKLELMSPLSAMDGIIANLGQSIILDITSLPKRYFFYILKRLFLSGGVKDLVVTYSLPEGYPPTALTADHDPWDALPSFRIADPDKEKRAHRRLIVNIGFMPEGLIAHLEGPAEELQIDVLVPFPAPIAAVQRVWQSVWALRSTPYQARFTESRIAANDLSEAFDVILSLLPTDSNLVSFAPFGPKPISAAMCLYAALTGAPVYYSQPKIYRPDYSVGVAKVGAGPTVHAYWIKHDGQSYFELPASRKLIKN